MTEFDYHGIAADARIIMDDIEDAIRAATEAGYTMEAVNVAVKVNPYDVTGYKVYKVDPFGGRTHSANGLSKAGAKTWSRRILAIQGAHILGTFDAVSDALAAERAARMKTD